VARRVMEFHFVGVLHGFYLAINHAWLMIFRTENRGGIAWLSGTLTFNSRDHRWVPFRADTIATTLSIWKSMAGLTHFVAESLGGLCCAYAWLTDLGLRFEGP
jgi:hypothetical protein